MKLKLIKCVDAYTFQPKCYIVDGDEDLIGDVLELENPLKQKFNNKEIRTKIINMVKSKLDPSRHGEVDELFETINKK